MSFAARSIDIGRGEPATAEQSPPLADRSAGAAGDAGDDAAVVAGADGRREHERVVLGLVGRLRRWIRAGPGRGQCGIPAGVEPDVHNVYAPGAWWCGDDRGPGPGDARLPALPDLAVEVLSPSAGRHGMRVKRTRYERLGLPELWVIDPERRAATLWRRSCAASPTFDQCCEIGADGQLASPQLPGFSVRLGDLLVD